MAKAKLTTPRAAFIIVMAAGAFFARAACAYATYYVPDVMFIKFNQDVSPEIVEGMEIDERLAFGARSGFYVGPGISEAVYQP